MEPHPLIYWDVPHLIHTITYFSRMILGITGDEFNSSWRWLHWTLHFEASSRTTTKWEREREREEKNLHKTRRLEPWLYGLQFDYIYSSSQVTTHNSAPFVASQLVWVDSFSSLLFPSIHSSGLQCSIAELDSFVQYNFDYPMWFVGWVLELE